MVGYWGGAYNAEMKRLMLDHAFRFVERVVFVVGGYTFPSQKALEKIGARASLDRWIPMSTARGRLCSP